MAQRIVEALIGRLISDEQFRADFLADPEGMLLGLVHRGLELTRLEITALLDTDPDLWSRAAAQLDSRLQKASLTSTALTQKESVHHG